MNIFYLDKNINNIPQLMVDSHIVKMVLETSQILSTVQYKINQKDAERYIEQGMIYKPTHINHPSVKWASLSLENYMWLAELGLLITEEYTHRYSKRHGCNEKLLFLASRNPNFVNIKFQPMTEEYQAVGDKYKYKDPVIAYRNYYYYEKIKKLRKVSFKRRQFPELWKYYDSKQTIEEAAKIYEKY